MHIDWNWGSSTPPLPDLVAVRVLLERAGIELSEWDTRALATAYRGAVEAAMEAVQAECVSAAREQAAKPKQRLNLA